MGGIVVGIDFFHVVTMILGDHVIFKQLQSDPSSVVIMAETDLVTVILLIVAIILVMVFLYVAGRIVAGKKHADAGYLVRLLVIAVIAVLALPILGVMVNSLNQIALNINQRQLGLADLLGLSQLIPVIIYLALVYLIRFLMLPERHEYSRMTNSIWIAFVALMLIFGLNALTQFLFQQSIIQAFG